MEFTAKLNYMRVSPQKARLVLDLIKGRRVEEALDTLRYTKKGIAPAIYKLLRSAVENANYVSAEKGLDIDLDRLYVKRAIANEGPRMKRIRPAPMGRAYPLPAPHLAPEHRAGGEAGRSAEGRNQWRNSRGYRRRNRPRRRSAKKAAAKKKAPAKKFAGKKTAQEVKQIPRLRREARRRSG